TTYSPPEKYTLSLHDALPIFERAFIYNLSNGPIEGMNNKIKNIKRSGYGYRNFRNLKQRILISFNLLNPLKPAKPLYFEEMKARSEEHTSELQSRFDIVCRLL